ncbi:hypothetical protein BpHYR1_035459 [Brachionus plicatilis]|uniref:Uncharacterized protein n=1 Tax=Brachionus plicatilis TaxID=10195 RepID=A0A3M7SRM6_BRAPC|nr:hypothetical protein BpHYR1_035459 [Brachionus plicatilis]
MNLNKEKNNLRLILLRIRKDYLPRITSSFKSPCIGLNVSFEFNVMPKNFTFSSRSIFKNEIINKIHFYKH